MGGLQGREGREGAAPPAHLWQGALLGAATLPRVQLLPMTFFNNKPAELQFGENLLYNLHTVARGDFQLLPLVHTGRRGGKGGKLSNSLIGFYNSLWGEMQACSLPSYEAWYVL